MSTAVQRQLEQPKTIRARVASNTEKARPVVFAVWQSDSRANGGVESITTIIEHFRNVSPILITQIETVANQRWRSAGYNVQVWSANTRCLTSVIRTNLRMYRLLRSTRCEVVHCNDISAVWHTAFGARLARASVVFNVRNIKPASQRYGWRWRVARRITNRQVLLSREMQTEFSRRVGARESNHNGDQQTEFIYSAVDAARFSPVDSQSRLRLRQQLGIPDNCFAIGCVSQFDERKAQLEFIKEGVPLLSPLLATAKVYFVGDFAPERNEYARRCRDAVRDLALREVVSFTGHAENIADWYRAFDLLVVTSRNEGLARCMIESLACGTPVVSFDVCSAREILESHECGAVVSNGNYKDLARQITLLATQPNTRARMAANGVGAVRQLFNPEAVSAQYERLYSKLRAN